MSTSFAIHRLAAHRLAGLAALVLALCPLAGARAADPAADASTAGLAPAPEPPVVFTLSRGQALPGQIATLVLSVKTAVPLRFLSISLDFEETKLRVFGSRRLLGRERDPATSAPTDIASTSVSNVDLERGDQVKEGWIHLEFDTLIQDRGLGLVEGVDTPLLEIDFLVLKGVPPGFSPVRFETVGPISAAPSAFYVNRVEAIADVAPTFDGLTPDSFRSGGIQIIGEVGFFMRGDSSFDRKRSITDPIITLAHLYLGGDPIECVDAADSNDDGFLNIADPIHTLSLLFQSAAPFPPPELWGPDPTPDQLGCAFYPGL